MKICIRCNKGKEVIDFYKHKAMADGHLSVCKTCKRKYSTNYYANNIDKVREYQSIPEVKSRKAILKKQWNIDNKDYVAETWQKFKPRRSELRKERYDNDPEYRILVLLRGRLYNALNGGAKAASTLELLGCTVKEFRIHLEFLFQKGMTWDNKGKWEIDHIKPCASFNLTDPEQQRKCFNYTNLQPLWAEDNRRKSYIG